MVDSYQIKTHRKKRINKKWKKKYGYSFIPKKEIFIMGNSVICHPSIAEKIMESAEAE